MIDELGAAIARRSPLKVDAVEYTDPTSTLIGHAWSLAITCPWQLRHGSGAVRWDDDAVEDALWDLIGHSIVDVRVRSPRSLHDPAFVLTDGFVIEIEADSDLDPWVLHLDKHVFVGMGPPS